MKGPENFNSEDIDKKAKELIDSLNLEDTEAGKYMEGESLPGERELKERSTEELPAQKESIENFLKKIEEHTQDGRKSGNAIATGSLKLPDGRIAQMWRMVETDDLPYYQASAALLVRELNEGGGWTQTNYFFYSDGRMEKGVAVKTPQDLEEMFRPSGAEEDDRAISRKHLNRIGEKIKAEQEEREKGLRDATEADMREAEKIFGLLEKGKE